MRKVVKGVLIVLTLVVIGIQFVRPERTNPPVDPARTLQANAQVPADVSAILTRACADCHSHETRWPWYSNIAPASWLVADDVQEGRTHMNISDWPAPERNGKRPEAVDKLEAICDEVQSGGMPIRAYLWLHPGAKLSEADVRTVCSWTESERTRLKGQASSGNSTR